MMFEEDRKRYQLRLSTRSPANGMVLGHAAMTVPSPAFLSRGLSADLDVNGSQPVNGLRVLDSCEISVRRYELVTATCDRADTTQES